MCFTWSILLESIHPAPPTDCPTLVNWTPFHCRAISHSCDRQHPPDKDCCSVCENVVRTEAFEKCMQYALDCKEQTRRRFAAYEARPKPAPRPPSENAKAWAKDVQVRVHAMV